MANEKKFHVAIKALVRDEEGKILILRVNPAQLKDNRHGIYWDLPGGRIEGNDSPETTLVKELEEKLNYYGTIHDIKLFHGSISKLDLIVDGEKYGLVLFVYTCKIDDEEISLSFEHTDYKWADIEEAKKLLSVKFSSEFIEKLGELKEPEVRDLGEG